MTQILILKSKLSGITCGSKNCKKLDCPFKHEMTIRHKRPRCDDEKFYAKWQRLIEEKENVGFAVFCSCQSNNSNLCKCSSIITG